MEEDSMFRKLTLVTLSLLVAVAGCNKSESNPTTVISITGPSPVAETPPPPPPPPTPTPTPPPPPTPTTFSATRTVTASATASCPSGTTGSPVTKTGTATATATSSASQADADAQANAQALILATANAQANANASLACTTVQPTLYSLTVNNGSGSGSYAAGTLVTIVANVAPAGQRFDVWAGNIWNLADLSSASTAIVMPASAVTVTATYLVVTPPTACTYGVVASLPDVPAQPVSGGSFLVNTSPGCLSATTVDMFWVGMKASSNAGPDITVTSGNGPVSVYYRVANNASGAIRIATFTVRFPDGTSKPVTLRQLAQ